MYSPVFSGSAISNLPAEFINATESAGGGGGTIPVSGNVAIAGNLSVTGTSTLQSISASGFTATSNSTLANLTVQSWMKAGSGTIYSTGTIAKTGSVVTGSGTTFSVLHRGGLFVSGSVIGIVSDWVSATQILVPVTGNISAGASYVIYYNGLQVSSNNGYVGASNLIAALNLYGISCYVQAVDTQSTTAPLNIGILSPSVLIGLTGASANAAGSLYVAQDFHAGSFGAAGATSNFLGTITGARTIGTSITASSQTLALSDANQFISCSNAGVTMNVSVPANATVAFPISTEIDLFQEGVAQLNVNPSGGVTFLCKNNNHKLAAQYTSCTLKKIASDTWLLVGDLTA